MSQTTSARHWFYQQMQTLGTDWQIITPNQRLALFLARDWADQQKVTVWQPCRISPWGQWLQELWQGYSLAQGRQGLSVPVVLSAGETLKIWEQLAGAHGAQAQEADRFVREWQLEQDPSFCNEHQLQQKQWQQVYAALKQDHQWLDALDILMLLQQSPDLFQDFLPGKLLLYGFLEFSPLQALCIATLEQAGVQVLRGFPDQQALLPDDQSAVVPVPLDAWPDARLELFGAAHWAQDCWAQLAAQQSFDQRNLFAGPRIAVVVPDLAQQQASVKAVFSEVLQWQGDLSGEQLAWTMSAGQALSDYPLLRLLLNLFNFTLHEVSLAVLEQILVASNWAQGIFKPLAPVLVAELREVGRQQWSLDDFRLWLARLLARSHGAVAELVASQELDSAAMLEVLHNLQHFRAAQRAARYTWRDWLSVLLELIELLHWPGDEQLDSVDYQLMQRWHAWWLAQENSPVALVSISVTSDVSSLKAPRKREALLIYREASARLEQAWREAMFQPEAETDRILVLGMLEAAALPLDAVYILGLTASHWPAASQPNPFLPYEEQRRQSVPRSTPVREIWYGKALLGMYRRCAHHLRLSYARALNDVPQFASPLISVFDNLVEHQQAEQPWQPRMTLRWHQPVDELPSLQGQIRLKGGAYALTQQALCPFQGAMAFHFGVPPAIEPRLTLTGADRGRWLHKVFEDIWQVLGSQEGLTRKSPAELEQLIERCTSAVIQQASAELPLLLTPLTREVELVRLAALVRASLALERQRPAFQVQGLEERVTLVRGECVFELRIDRWDLQADQWVLIDYKTTLPNSHEARLVTPQPILYALALAQKLRLDEAGLARRLASAVFFSHKPSDGVKWQDVMQDQDPDLWLQTQTRQLDDLITEVRAGASQLAPLEGLTTCSACHFQSSCRVKQRVLGHNAGHVSTYQLQDV